MDAIRWQRDAAAALDEKDGEDDQRRVEGIVHGEPPAPDEGGGGAHGVHCADDEERGVEAGLQVCRADRVQGCLVFVCQIRWLDAPDQREVPLDHGAVEEDFRIEIAEVEEDAEPVEGIFAAHVAKVSDVVFRKAEFHGEARAPGLEDGVGGRCYVVDNVAFLLVGCDVATVETCEDLGNDVV